MIYLKSNEEQNGEVNAVCNYSKSGGNKLVLDNNVLMI